MALLTVEDVATWMQVSFTVEQQEQVQMVIDSVVAALEEEINRPPEARAIVNERVLVTVLGTAIPQHTPVQSVQAVRDLDSVAYTGPWDVEEWGVNFSEGFAPSELYVDYTAGFAANTPEWNACRGLALKPIASMISKALDDAVGLDGLTQEGYAPQYARDEWNAREARVIQRLRRRVAV